MIVEDTLELEYLNSILILVLD